MKLVWTDELDAKLIAFVREHGDRPWTYLDSHHDKIWSDAAVQFSCSPKETWTRYLELRRKGRGRGIGHTQPWRRGPVGRRR